MFYDKFSAICRAKGISPSKVVRDIGLSTGVMQKWKNGGEPSNPTFVKICTYLNVPQSYFEEEVESDGLTNEQKILFDAVKDASPQEISQTIAILLALKKSNGNN